MKKNSVLFLLKKRNVSYGAPFGLLYSARFVAEFLRLAGHEAHVIQVTDGNDIDREVTKLNPNIVILEALWATPGKVKELMDLERHKGREWVIRLHSRPTFLSMEGIAMEWLGDFVNLARQKYPITLAVNNPIAAREFGLAFRHRFELLPNIYFGRKSDAQKRYMRAASVVNVGCFGAQRPLKNVLEQAIAAVIYADAVGKKLRFFINATRVEQHGENVLKNVRELFASRPNHELVEISWKSHGDFMEVVKQMDLGMQVSLNESFNIVTADFVAAGVPIVVSDEIAWMPNMNKVTATNALKIALKLGDLYFLPRFLVAWRQRRALDRYNRASRKQWLSFMGV